MIEKLKELFNGNKKDTEGKISLWSYQRFCQFYGYTVFNEENFEENMQELTDLVVVQKITDIKGLAEIMKIDLKDCLFKLRYLKNKRWIPSEYYINNTLNTIKECSESDLLLINKYYDMIYYKHYRIDEIVGKLREQYQDLTSSELKNIVFKEIKYLYESSLLSGFKLDEENIEIIYYSLEKHKKSKIFVSIRCPNCGALVDVLKYNDGKCGYCNTLVEDTYSKGGNE